MKVLIVGAGMGGLALGAFLKRLDIDFDIVEKCSDWNRQGYSLGIWDNGRDILRKLGLEDEFDKNGERIKEFVVCDGKSNVLKKYNLKEFYTDYGSAYTHLNRNLLHNWLLDLVGMDKVKMSTPIENLEQINGYDVVVGADGVHSQIRNLVFIDKDYEHYSEWRAWFVRVDNKYKKESSVVQYIEPRQFISIFDDKNETLAVFLAPAKHSEWDEEKGRAERLVKLFNRHTKVPEMLKNSNDAEITPTNLSFVDMNKWVKGNVALLGDAAHAMEPFAGLGASMAMEDAYILAGELLKVKNGNQSIENALGNYEKTRRERVRLAKKATANMRWWAMSKSNILVRVFRLVAAHSPTNYFTKDFHKLLKQEI